MKNKLKDDFTRRESLLFVFSLIGLAAATAAMLLLLLTHERKPVYSPDLRELDLRGEDVSTKYIEELRVALPDCDITWDVPLSGGRYDSSSEDLVLSSLSLSDVPMFENFPKLTRVLAPDCGDTEALAALQAAYPDIDVEYFVPFGDTKVRSHDKRVSLSLAEASYEELSEKLAYLPDVRAVSVSGDPFSVEEELALFEQYPDIVFSWPVELLGGEFPSDTETLSFAERDDLTEASLRELAAATERFPQLKTVDLTDCGFEIGRLRELDAELGDIDVAYPFTIYGKTVCSTDEEVDLSGIRVNDKAAEIEEAVPYMHRLRRVVMAECGLTNAFMDELNNKYEDIRFVWMVQIKWAGILTDSTHYIPYPESGAKQFPTVQSLDALQYCPDLIACDLGHSNIKHLNFLSVMPNLQYLILADSWVEDIELVGTLTELKWLEIFKTVVDDISPLLNCTKLEDLNICYITTDGDNLYKTLSQMKSLKRLWCCGTYMTQEQVDSLRELLPGCEIYDKFGAESTGGTWRYSESYYEMRDAFHMYYMSDDGNTVGRLSPEELAAKHKKVWGY